MLKTTFTASYVDGTTRELPGYSVAPGLVVHRAVTMRGEETADWNVAHAVSGDRVCGSFPTRKQATVAAIEFAKLADWTLPKGHFQFDNVEIFRQVQTIRSAILWGGGPFDTAHPASQNQGRFF